MRSGRTSSGLSPTRTRGGEGKDLSEREDECHAIIVLRSRILKTSASDNRARLNSQTPPAQRGEREKRRGSRGFRRVLGCVSLSLSDPHLRPLMREPLGSHTPGRPSQPEQQKLSSSQRDSSRLHSTAPTPSPSQARHRPRGRDPDRRFPVWLSHSLDPLKGLTPSPCAVLTLLASPPCTPPSPSPPRDHICPPALQLEPTLKVVHPSAASEPGL